MSDKDRQKKDGERKDKENKAMKEAQRVPAEKSERSQQKGDDIESDLSGQR